MLRTHEHLTYQTSVFHGAVYQISWVLLNSLTAKPFATHLLFRDRVTIRYNKPMSSYDFVDAISAVHDQRKTACGLLFVAPF